MKIRCDKCDTKYSIADEKVRGKVFKIKCKRCSNIIVVRGTEDPEPERPAIFDQSETRVFDYGSGQNPEIAASAGGADAVWYVVIAGEQVGPLSAAQIGDKWQRAEVDADTYAWREGQADWSRIADIDDLKYLTTGGSAAGEVGGNPFATNADGGADPADLFGGASSGAADLFGGSPAFGGGDLFSGSAPSRGADLFAAAPAPAASFGHSGNGKGASGRVAAAVGPRVEVNPGMTGQRNENSVLFSLSNLAQLAGDGGGAQGARRAH